MTDTNEPRKRRTKTGADIAALVSALSLPELKAFAAALPPEVKAFLKMAPQ